jgi:short-subunit dehydrogenase
MQHTRSGVALVTGTSSGIGLETAVALAKAGFTVVATMRNPERAQALRAKVQEATVEVDIRKLDITSDAEAEQCISEVLATHGTIDVLVNNAGSGFVGTLEQVSLDEIREVLEVDFLGTARMTKLVLPHMRERGVGRILSVTSVGGVVGQPFNDVYCAAKFAVEGLLEGLAPVAQSFGVHIAVIEPGAVASAFIDNAAPSVEARSQAGNDPYQALWQNYLKVVNGSFSSAQNPAEVAQVLVQAATEENPRFRYQTSPSSQAFAGLKLSDLDGSKVQGMTGRWIQ